MICVTRLTCDHWCMSGCTISPHFLTRWRSTVVAIEFVISIYVKCNQLIAQEFIRPSLNPVFSMQKCIQITGHTRETAFVHVLGLPYNAVQRAPLMRMPRCVQRRQMRAATRSRLAADSCRSRRAADRRRAEELRRAQNASLASSCDAH